MAGSNPSMIINVWSQDTRNIPEHPGLHMSTVVNPFPWFHWHCLALWCFHIFWSPNSVMEASLCMLLILSQPAQNIAFSQVNASGLSSVPFFLFPNSQLIPSCRKHRVFTGKGCMCLSSHFFLFPISRLIRLMWPCQWIMSFFLRAASWKKTCLLFFKELSHGAQVAKSTGKATSNELVVN